MTTKLNHINLAVSDVPALAGFFQNVFDFRVEETRGVENFCVMEGQDGFALVLSHDKRVRNEPYPAMFHVGFLTESHEQVMERHKRMTGAGFEAPEPAILLRGGPKTFGFYAKVQGVMVEVSCPA